MEWNCILLCQMRLLAEVAQPTLAESLAVPLIMLILTSIVTLVGGLVTWEVQRFRSTLNDHEERLDLITFYLVKVMSENGIRGGSDLVLKRNRKGESSAG